MLYMTEIKQELTIKQEPREIYGIVIETISTCAHQHAHPDRVPEINLQSAESSNGMEDFNDSAEVKLEKMKVES